MARAWSMSLGTRGTNLDESAVMQLDMVPGKGQLQRQAVLSTVTRRMSLTGGTVSVDMIKRIH